MGIKNKLGNFLIKTGIYRIRPTSIAELTLLLSQIRPVETNHTLIRVGEDYDGGYLVPDDFKWY